MKKNYFVFIVILLFPHLSEGSVNSNHDFQLWESNTISKKLSEKTQIALESELRWGDGAATLYHWYVQTRLFYSFYKWLEIAPGYRHQYNLHPQDKKWELEKIPFGDLFFKFNLNEWKLTDRNRIQYVILKSQLNHWVYRNQMTLQSPWEFGPVGLNPMATEEVFFKEREGYSENRLAFGLGFKFSKINKNTILFMFRNIKRDEGWIYQQVLFFSVNFTF